MIIQFNTDKTISGEERNEAFFTSLISEELSRFQSHISRIEVHLSDENGIKEGRNNILCLLEARLEGRKPLAVSNQADTIDLAISGGLEKLVTTLETILGKIKNY